MRETTPRETSLYATSLHHLGADVMVTLVFRQARKSFTDGYVILRSVSPRRFKRMYGSAEDDLVDTGRGLYQTWPPFL
jgi:hypothetical protein